MRYLVTVSLAAAAFVLSSGPILAANDSIDAKVMHLAREWARAKYLVHNPAKSKRQMNALGAEADHLLAQNPNSAEAMIWDGILTSERASMASMFSALSLAKRARKILEKANRLDPRVLDAGAPTSLGVLYYRVPGFPIGFGDKKKARRLLQTAVRNAPNGMDAWYFYGDFLNEQQEYKKAAAALKHMLALPKHPDRPVWDKYRRIVARELLEKVQQNMKP